MNLSDFVGAPFNSPNDAESAEVGKKSRNASDFHGGPLAAGLQPFFPETQTGILRDAAQGAWSDFFRQYLHPCWREIEFACRKRGIPVSQTDDLFQELMVRLLRDGRFNTEFRSKQETGRSATTFRGNLPAKYLKYRELPMKSARFRTFLKRVIQNLILESIRSRNRQPRSLDSTQGDNIPESRWIGDSISYTLERRWVVQCLDEAAFQFNLACRRAMTKGRKRLFDVLYLSAVEARPHGEIARTLGLDRTTVTELVQLARLEYVKTLRVVTGVRDIAELRKLLRNAGEALSDALVRARERSYDAAE